ncbi:MAG: hypothetical protein JJ900_17985 [Rhodospirillales bacterium]|nr:hypothetical protein [Rhodospirillales bacterium]MBO6788742.1 hypothetical protein [Rhodospirillales bacterium]
MRTMILKCALLGAVVMVSACQTKYADRPWYDPLNMQVEMKPRQEKNLQVAPSEIAFALQFPTGSATLGAAERRAAVSFLQRRATAQSDEIIVDFGLLHETTDLAYDRRTTIAAVMADAGLDPMRVKARANVAGIAENEVNLTVRRYLVTLPGCPDFTSYAGRTFDNRPHPNWGCPNSTNLGLMVAEPQDLVNGRGGTPGDAEALVLGTQRYRAGEQRALPLGDTNTAESHGVDGSSGSGEGK